MYILIPDNKPNVRLGKVLIRTTNMNQVKMIKDQKEKVIICQLPIIINNMNQMKEVKCKW